METQNVLANISRARQILAEARDITDVLDIRDAAVAAHAYAKAKNADEAAQMAMELKLRSERRAGEFLQEMKENGTIGKGIKSNTLSDFDIKQQESTRWQRLAKIPEELFEEYLMYAAKRTQSTLLRIAGRIVGRGDIRDRREERRRYWSEEIKIFLAENEWLRSLVNYPSRGPFGLHDFPGNASGWLLVQLIDHFTPTSVFDPMEGSGTSRDVCEAMNIHYYGNDLKNSDGYDLTEAPLDQLPAVDLTYFHPPYHNIIRYTDHPHDLSNQPNYASFIKILYTCIDKLLPKTKILAVLVGDIFEKETFQYWSIGGDLYEKYKDRLIWRLLKAQHSVSSGFADIALKQRNPLYIPLRHEDIYLLRGDLQ